MDKKSFIFHTEWGRLFRRLSDADCKRLLQMMCDYAADNIEPEDTPDMVGMAFDCIRGLMDFDKERYHATCEKRRQAVQKRWDKQKQKDAEQEQEGTKNTNVSTCIDGDTKYTYTESDTECECIINNTHTHTRTHARTQLTSVRPRSLTEWGTHARTQQKAKGVTLADTLFHCRKKMRWRITTPSRQATRMTGQTVHPCKQRSQHWSRCKHMQTNSRQLPIRNGFIITLLQMAR